MRAETGPPRIELRIGPAAGEAVAVVSGPDPAEAVLEWEAIRSAGGIDLTAIDERAFGDLRLSVLADADVPAAGSAGRVRRDPGPFLRYRYGFEAGRLVEAGSWGPGASLRFDVTASDSDGCGAESLLNFDGR